MIEIRNNNQVYKIENSKIVYAESEGHYVYFYVRNNIGKPDVVVCKCRDKLSAVAKMLGTDFIRVHQRYLLNKSYICEISKKTAKVRVKGNCCLMFPVSKSYNKFVEK